MPHAGVDYGDDAAGVCDGSVGVAAMCVLKKTFCFSVSGFHCRRVVCACSAGAVGSFSIY